MAKLGEFFTQWIRPEKEQFLEINSGDDIVSHDYVPLNVQIATMTEAGVRLAEYRKTQYHFEQDEKVPDDFIDLNIQPGIDPADVQAVTDELKVKMKGEAADQKAKAIKASRESAVRAMEKGVEEAKARQKDGSSE